MITGTILRSVLAGRRRTRRLRLYLGVASFKLRRRRNQRNREVKCRRQCNVFEGNVKVPMPEFARMTLNDSRLISGRVVNVNAMARRVGMRMIALVVVIAMSVNVFGISVMRARVQAVLTRVMVNMRMVAPVMVVKRCAHDCGSS